MKLKAAINDIKKDVLHPVYLLKGNDHYLQNFFIDQLASKYFDASPVEKLYLLPDDMSGKEIIDNLTTNDLFSTKKLFIIRNPQKLKGKASLDLVNICKNSVIDHIVVLVNDDWLARSSFIGKIEKFISPIDVQTPFTNGMKKWANYLISKRGKSSNFKIDELLVDMAGDSVGHLDNEIEKICLLIGSRNNIEIEDVEQFSGWKRERQRWEFLLAFGDRDYSKAMKLGKNIITNNESMLSLVIPLTTLFQEILFYKMKNGTYDEYRGYIPIPPSVKKRISSFSRSFKMKELESALMILGNIDKRQKTAYSRDETELIQLIGNVIG